MRLILKISLLKNEDKGNKRNKIENDRKNFNISFLKIFLLKNEREKESTS